LGVEKLCPSSVKTKRKTKKTSPKTDAPSPGFAHPKKKTICVLENGVKIESRKKI
jgi:hypothetical protein